MLQQCYYFFETECPDEVPDEIAPRADYYEETYYRYCQSGMVYINPDDISDSAKEIRIIGTPVNTVLDYTFGSKQLCRILSLAFNMIHTIEVHAFRNMYSLEELHLNNNKLSSLPRGIFDHIDPSNPLVTHIYLQGNQLTSLTLGLFSKLARLAYLDLQQNLLGTLSQELINDLDGIGTILIGIPIGEIKIILF